MTRRRFATSTALAVIGVVALAVPALAQAEPGFLEAADLPGGLEAVGEPTTSTTVNAFVIDTTACSQTIEPDPTAESVALLQFQDPATSATTLTESIVTFPNAKAAKRAFNRYGATTRAGVECGSVDTEIPDAQPGTPSSSAIVYESVKFPKIADGSYGIVRGGSAADNVAASFVSGPYVVVLGTYGGGDAPNLKQLAAIARKANTALDT